MPRVVAVALALLAFFWQASHYPAQPNSDDAYISFRYAENLAHGQGLVFNPGERVEGYTNLLWVVLLAGLHRLGADTPSAAHLLSLLLGAATIALSPVGAIPYFSGLPTIDILGLTDAHVARVPADPTIASKGHQKHDGAYILSRKPSVLLGNGVIVSRDGARPGALWWWPNAGFGPDGRLVPGQRLDWWREGWSLRYEADIEGEPRVRPRVQAGAAAAAGRLRSLGLAWPP